jgi:putative nucleotidyltransferase with HDIG domain
MEPLTLRSTQTARRAGLHGLSPTRTGGSYNLAALSHALQSQDPYTQGHSRRVADYAEWLSRQLGLCRSEIETVRFSALLHDIGKIAFSAKLLHNTKAQLTEAMRAEIRRHPSIGADLLRGLGVAGPVVDCVRYHHERIDGAGYPVGLRGQEIPLSAQIISVADCYDALTTDRPYQKGRSTAEALSVMESLGGNALCPQLTRAFCAGGMNGGGRAN